MIEYKTKLGLVTHKRLPRKLKKKLQKNFTKKFIEYVDNLKKLHGDQWMNYFNTIV